MKAIKAIEFMASHLILSWGWKRRFWALAAGALSALAMPPFDFFPVLFLTFPALVWLMDATALDPATSLLARAARGFATGWWFGFGYFVAGLWWIGNAFLVEAEQFAWLLPLPVLALPALLAVFWGIGTALARLLWKDGARRIAALAAGIGVAELMRGTLFSGLPWNSIGEAAMTVPLTMQKASLLGLYGVGAIAVFVFASPALLAPRLAGKNRRVFVLVLGVIAADLAFGGWRLATSPATRVEGVSLRLVQPAIDQSEKWSPEMESRNFKLLMDLSVSSISAEKPGLSGTTLLVWPETAFPFILKERRDALAALGAMLPDGTVLAAGAVRFEPPAPGDNRELAFNSVYTIDDKGEISGASDKVHLVPFGEYLPLKELAERLGLEQLTRMRGGFEAGSRRALLNAGPAGSFLPLICYEIIFPGEATRGVTRPGFILNVTNDGWFGMTPGPFQHWRQAVLRGVETGLPVVRSANSGISSVSDANGRTVEKIGLGVRAIADTELPIALAETPYSRLGNSLFWLIIAGFLAFSALPARDH